MIAKSRHVVSEGAYEQANIQSTAANIKSHFAG